MATERSRQIVLAGLVIVLVAVIVKMWPGTSAAPAPTSNRAERSSAARPPQADTPTAPAVHLNTLNAERPQPEPVQRNLFRFKPKAPPPPPPAPVRPVQPAEPVAPTGPPPPPPLAPIS